jgi:hypothetical protein
VLRRRKKNRENFPAIRDHKGNLITDRIEKANSLNLYYAPLFICERNDPPTQSTESGQPFTISKEAIISNREKEIRLTT